MGLIPGGDGAVNYIIEQPNRGKRSIGIDISTEGGRDLLYKLAETSDVFLTSFLPAVRQRLEDRRRAHQGGQPGHRLRPGLGPGPARARPREGRVRRLPPTGAGAGWPTPSPRPTANYPIGGRPAFGDLAGGMAIAGGIAAGLLQKEKTGEAPIIDVSLLGLAMWQLSPDIVASGLYGGDPMPKFDRTSSPNPLVGNYRTSDDRFITLMMLQSDRFWPDFCRHIDRPELIEDPRFADGAARYANSKECIGIMDEVFASKTYTEWKEKLATLEGCGLRARCRASWSTIPRSVPTDTCPLWSGRTGTTSNWWPTRSR